MKKNVKLPIAILATILALNLSACSLGTATSTVDSASTTTQNSELSSQYFDSEDFDASYDSASANKITLNGDSIEGTGITIDGTTATITNAGVYEISGTLTDGQIIVNSAAKGTVRIILNNANISCSTNAPIFVQQSDKTIITLPDGTKNTISDGQTYTLNSDDEPTACLFSKDNLVINGTGYLTVNAAYNDGISGKDDLKISQANINITSADDGIVGKDLLAIASATLTVHAQGDGLKASNDSDTESGILYIESGTFNIEATNDSIHSNGTVSILDGTFNMSSGDDGIHADSDVIIDGGSIAISKSNEGIEGSNITMNAGDIDITASDDGINVAGDNDDSSTNENAKQNTSSDSTSHALAINGGNILVNADGDGIDVNGSATMTDGYVIVNGPTNSGNGALDYDGTFDVTGGTICAFGSTGMTMSPSSTSSVLSFSMTFDEIKSAGTTVSVNNSSGTEMLSFTSEKDFQNVVIACADFELDAEYTILSNNETAVTFTPTETVTYVTKDGISENGAGMGGGMGGKRGQNGADPSGEFLEGERPSGERPSGEPPQGATDIKLPTNDTSSETTN
jgi:hypothetical protein